MARVETAHAVLMALATGALAPLALASETFSANALVTPVIDGVISSGEWDDADRRDFMATCGDGEVSGSFYVKNDGTNLYLAAVLRGVRYQGSFGGFDFLNTVFDNDASDGTPQPGDNYWAVRAFDDLNFDNYIINTAGHVSADVGGGGTQDFVGAVSHTNPVPDGPGDYSVEYCGALDSADDAHDFSLQAGDLVGFRFTAAVVGCGFIWGPNYIVIAGDDTDQDGLSDVEEVHIYGTDPDDPDTDDDSLTDGDEVALAGAGSCPDPLVADSDVDGLGDGLEVASMLDPCDPDSDDDGLADGNEAEHGTSPLDADTDGDGLLDGAEVDAAQGGGCPDPVDADSDDDGLSDGAETAGGTSPCSADTDGDGVPDGTDPLPAVPGVTSEFLEGLCRALSTIDIPGLDLSLFNGPNRSARAQRRNVLAKLAAAAADAIAVGDYEQAILDLKALLQRIDGVNPPPDWMNDSAEKTALAGQVRLYIDLLELFQ